MNEKNTNGKTTEESKKIRLRLVGEIPGYYRHYYENTETNEFYALVNFRGVRTWHTTVCNGGELDMPLKDGLVIEIEGNEQIISKEIITHVDDCTSIGIPVIDPPDPDVKPRRGTGKKVAADIPPYPVE